MYIRNYMAESPFNYIPKTTTNNSTKTDFLSTKKNSNLFTKQKFVFFPRGNSTFDFLNDLNKDKYKYPKLKPPFLTKSKRSIKIHKNILNKIKFKKKIINSSSKYKLSDSCEFFYKLNKTYLTNKDSLKKTNTMNRIFKDNDSVSNISNSEIDKDISFKRFLGKTYLNSSQKNIINLKIQNIKIKEMTNSKQQQETNINFLYNKIFPKCFVDHNANYNVIDNKLNLFYAEDAAHFKKKLMLKNQILMKKGKKLRKMVLDQKDSTEKLKEVKKTIGFIKGITDYSYPDIVLQKSKLKYNIINLKKKKTMKFKLPYQKFEEEKNKANLIRAKSLSETILINNKKLINKLNISL